MDGFIPYDLSWVDTGDTRREILGKREEGLVELIIGVRSDPESWWLQPYDPLHSIGFGNLGGLPETPEPPFKAFLQVTAYAENLAEPVVQLFEATYDRPSELGSLKLQLTGLEIEQ